jgi:hypothetical protein
MEVKSGCQMSHHFNALDLKSLETFTIIYMYDVDWDINLMRYIAVLVSQRWVGQ